MRVAVICTYAKGATVNRVASILNILTEHEVHLVGMCNSDLLATNLLENKKVEIHHIAPQKVDNSANFILRYLAEFRYGLKCSKKARALNCDFEIITVPFIALIVTSILIKSRAKKILDVRDIVWEYLDNRSWFKRVLKWGLKTLHLYFMKKYDFLTVTNPHEMAVLDKTFTGPSKVMIPNGISRYQFGEIQRLQNNKSLSKDAVIRITYVGNVGIAQNIATFIEAIEGMAGFELVVVGDGNDFDRLSEMVKSKKLTNVKLVGRVSPDKVFDYYTNTQLLWAKLDAGYESAVPSKLYEYLATGMPVIYSGKGAALDLLSNFQNVFICEDNVESLRELLTMLQKKVSTDIKYSDENIHRIRANYIREDMNKKFLELINSNE